MAAFDLPRTGRQLPAVDRDEALHPLQELLAAQYQLHTAAQHRFQLSPLIHGQLPNREIQRRQDLAQALVPGDQQRRGTGRAGEQRQGLPVTAFPGSENAPLVVQKAVFSPACDRQLLDHINLQRIRPAAAHGRLVYPGQALQLPAHLLQVRLQEATGKGGLHHRLDRLRLGMFEFPRDRNALHGDCLDGEPGPGGSHQHHAGTEHDQHPIQPDRGLTGAPGRSFPLARRALLRTATTASHLGSGPAPTTGPQGGLGRFFLHRYAHISGAPAS
jgi:hypothetical protein